MTKRNIFYAKRVCHALCALAIPQLVLAQIVVPTVPWQPSNPTAPHTTYNLCTNFTIPNYATNPPSCAGAALQEANIRLGAIVTLPNTSDTYSGVWNFGDGSANFTFPVAHTSLVNYDVSTTHQYPAAGPAGKTYTAVLTITDLTTSAQGSGSYYVMQEEDTLSARVNVAIDSGLWFVHTVMWRGTTTVNGNTVNWGGWDNADGIPSGVCNSLVVCSGYGGIDANYVQAFEVNGHLENGPASNPYTDDVARGLARMMHFLIPAPTASKSIAINPAILVDRCSDGSAPDFTQTPPACAAPATLIEYNPAATSCTSPPCAYTFDLNANGQMLMEGNDMLGAYQPLYQMGMFMDALVASGNPAGIAKAGPAASGGLPGVLGQTYQNIVTDLAEGISYCQYYADPNNDTMNGSDAGGGWQYSCAATSLPNYNDNSISQWNAVGLIGAERGFGVPIPQITKDTNQIWVTWSQNVNGALAYIGIADNGSLTGTFGYNSWVNVVSGPFAATPAGMVQMSMDAVGRTAANNPDQRWNMAETFYRDNFCYNANAEIGFLNYNWEPLYYTYGMFSFAKAMLLHDPGGALSPITTIADQPSGANPIDWYGALSATFGGSDACDGFAQTLVSRQGGDGHWGGTVAGQFFDAYNSQGVFETAWALIILRQSIFVNCINDLYGKGKPATRFSKATVTLTWAHQPNALSYDVLRSDSAGGPFTKIGSSPYTVFVDQNGLRNNSTYYYAVNPVNSIGTDICQSNRVAVRVPRYHE